MGFYAAQGRKAKLSYERAAESSKSLVAFPTFSDDAPSQPDLSGLTRKSSPGQRHRLPLSDDSSIDLPHWDFPYFPEAGLRQMRTAVNCVLRGNISREWRSRNTLDFVASHLQ